MDPTHVLRYRLGWLLAELNRSPRFAYSLHPLGFADHWRRHPWCRPLDAIARRVALCSPTVLSGPPPDGSGRAFWDPVVRACPDPFGRTSADRSGRASARSGGPGDSRPAGVAGASLGQRLAHASLPRPPDRLGGGGRRPPSPPPPASSRTGWNRSTMRSP